MSQRVQPTDSRTSSLILIGMAGAGKSTIGRRLAQALSYSHVDTDHILEAWWGMDLQSLSEYLSRDQFIQAEARMIQSLDITRSVISTGGSVIYNRTSVQHLKQLGICIYLTADLTTIRQRIARAPLRGLAMASGQSIEDVYMERKPLYEEAADISVPTDILSIEECVAQILHCME